MEQKNNEAAANELHQKVRIGIIARCDNGGLGIMAFDFFRNVMVEKVLVISSSYENYHDRFDGYVGTRPIICSRGMPALDEIDDFLEGMDVVVAFETPYNWNIFARAKERGIKTVLIPMYEWTPENDQIPVMPDLFLCPSELDYREMPEPKKFLPTPINRAIIPYKRRSAAKTFLFHNGHGGFGGRNALDVLMQAIPLVKSDVEFIIRSQVPFQPINDTRIIAQQGEVNYEDLWKEGDIYLHLHRWDGLSLPLNEAMAAGIPVIAPDFFPHNAFLPKELLVPIEATARGSLTEGYRKIDMYVFSPVKVAEMIDKVAAMSVDQIQQLSDEVDVQASKWSWEKLRREYLETFNTLCGK